MKEKVRIYTETLLEEIEKAFSLPFKEAKTENVATFPHFALKCKTSKSLAESSAFSLIQSSVQQVLVELILATINKRKFVRND